ncbi:MAG: hypothetical protein NC253_03995 [Ruminococcus sp.]|nr:hypothetical protein [Ruminococcus sp.]MCM1381146.1 hypothetical protein [Muribaculaceae bacterium]MCM1478821.1 hypothetical protein [Muribaculaceae bacterium]
MNFWENTVKLFSKKFHFYNIAVLLMQIPMTALAVSTGYMLFEIFQIISFVLLIINAAYIAVKVIKGNSKEGKL